MYLRCCLLAQHRYNANPCCSAPSHVHLDPLPLPGAFGNLKYEITLDEAAWVEREVRRMHGVDAARA